MSIELITPPTAEPVSQAQLMQQMGFGAVSDGILEATLQAQLTTALLAARHNIEGFLRRVLITQHWLLRRNMFSHRGIDLPKAPFQSIDWFKYVDTFANVDQLFQDTTYGQDFPAPYGYQLERGSETQPATLYPPWAKPWPPTLRVPSAVMVQFRCGYGGPADVSMTADSAILVGPVFNPDDAPLMTGDTGTPVSVVGAGEDGLDGPPLIANVASVDVNGQATLSVPASTAVPDGEAWIGHPVPPDITKAILLLGQFYYEQASVGGEIPRYITDSIWCYRNLVS
jgi:hypothetical protein